MRCPTDYTLALLFTNVWVSSCEDCSSSSCLFAVSKLRCMEAQHQIVFTLLIVLGQMLLVALSLGIQPPGVIREVRLNEDNTINTPTVVITCKSDHIVALVLSAVYESGLLIVATVLGTLSYKYPANFNESKCICFSAFSLLVIWVAFIPTYIATQARQEIQNSFIACAVAVSAFAILICFFSPKVVVIFFWRERNSKHYCRRRVGSDKYDVNPRGSMLTTTTSALEMSYTGNSAIAERQEPGTAQYQILLQMIINPLLHNYLYISNVFTFR